MNEETVWRPVSVEGCALLGEGYYKKAYLLEDGTALVLHKPAAESEPSAQHLDPAIFESTLASFRKAQFLYAHGVPMPEYLYLAEAEGCPGVVMECIRSHTLMGCLKVEPERAEEYGVRCAEMLRALHSIHVLPKNKGSCSCTSGKPILPSVHECFLKMVESFRPLITDVQAEKAMEVICRIPVRDTLIHGDFRPRNIMMRKGALIFIDCDEAAFGHPILELVSLYSAVVMAAHDTPQFSVKTSGLPAGTIVRFWNALLPAYLCTSDRMHIKEAERTVTGFAQLRKAAGIVRHSRDPIALQALPLLLNRFFAQAVSLRISF